MQFVLTFVRLSSLWCRFTLEAFYLYSIEKIISRLVRCVKSSFRGRDDGNSNYRNFNITAAEISQVFLGAILNFCFCTKILLKFHSSESADDGLKFIPWKLKRFTCSCHKIVINIQLNEFIFHKCSRNIQVSLGKQSIVDESCICWKNSENEDSSILQVSQVIKVECCWVVTCVLLIKRLSFQINSGKLSFPLENEKAFRYSTMCWKNARRVKTVENC